MRPRPDATENEEIRVYHALTPKCFNEAAARCHGKRPRAPQDPRAKTRRFNEAAARCHGKLESGAAPATCNALQ